MATLKGPGRLPAPENLRAKGPEELIGTLRRFGMNLDVTALQAKADSAFLKRVAPILRQGVLPDEETMASISKQHEKDLAHGLRTMTKSAIRQYRDERASGENFMWVTVEDENVCPSCEKRHGKVKSMKQWAVLGKPGSAALICKDECRCELAPV